jgi:hypothetical protein
MKIIKTSELKVGDIFAKEMKLHGRTAFEVTEVPEGRNFIIVKERIPRSNNQKLSIENLKSVYYLKNIFEP